MRWSHQGQEAGEEAGIPVSQPEGRQLWLQALKNLTLGQQS